VQCPKTTANHIDDIGHVSIDTLHDEVLLEIFAFCLCGHGSEDIWQTLVHVCRRWRAIVLASPRSLNLRIVCTSETPVEWALDVWPPFPLVIRLWDLCDEMDDNLLAAFDHSDRICEIYVDDVSDGGTAELALVMEDPFPELTVLDIRSYECPGPALLPDFLLGGSAPRLRSLHLEGIAFPALPKLLLSATGLVCLHLVNIPLNGYISPEAMADCLSRLTRLNQLQIEFRAAQRCPDQTRRPLARTVLSVLTSFAFKGRREYLDHLLAHIHIPRPKHVKIKFFNSVIFDVSQISQLTGLTETFEAFDRAYMLFNSDFVHLTLFSSRGATRGMSLKLFIKYRDSVWRLKSLAWSRRPFLPLSANSDSFDVEGSKVRYGSIWAEYTMTIRWWTLLRFFTTVENLYLSEGVGRCVTFALGTLAAGGVVAELLPALQNVFIERLQLLESGSSQGAIRTFATARELSGRPVTFRRWVKKVRQ